MKTRLLPLFLVIAIVASFVIAPLGQVTAAQTSTTFPVSGTGTTAQGLPVNFDGTFAIKNFKVSGDQVVAKGTLNGTITDAVTGEVIDTVSNLRTSIGLITGSATTDCEILSLVLGPLDLDLLGLEVHLDQVVLDITAVPGAGNLLGNLLCAVAGLLDSNGPLNIVADLLNSVLDVLEWIG